MLQILPLTLEAEHDSSLDQLRVVLGYVSKGLNGHGPCGNLFFELGCFEAVAPNVAAQVGLPTRKGGDKALSCVILSHDYDCFIIFFANVDAFA